MIFDLVRTTLTTKGEGALSSLVTGSLRKLLNMLVQVGYRPSEVAGAFSVSVLTLVWLGGLWAGWTMVFCGLTDPIAHSGKTAAVDVYDVLYFTGFTLTTLGVGDLIPTTFVAQILTVLASLNGLLVITLVVTYALSVVSGVVARRTLAYKIYLTGGDEGEFLTAFTNVEEFGAWLGSIKQELIPCTEQRLAYPVLDNFITRDRRFSLPSQLAKLGLAAQRESQAESPGQQTARELSALLTVVDRYVALTGLRGGDLTTKLEKLSQRDA